MEGTTGKHWHHKYRVKAVRGQWDVKQIYFRSEHDIKRGEEEMKLTGFIVYNSELVDPVPIIEACANVGISYGQNHDDKSIIFVNRGEWSWFHSVSEQAEKLLKDDVSNEELKKKD